MEVIHKSFILETCEQSIHIVREYASGSSGRSKHTLVYVDYSAVIVLVNKVVSRRVSR